MKKHDEDMLDNYDFSKAKRGSVRPQKGKTRITIWIDDDILNWFRETAESEGAGYQTMLNTALRQYTGKGSGALRRLVRDIVLEELQERHAS